MKKAIKSKVELNRVTHSVRALQAVLQYGVGAMVDFPDQTLVTASPEYWNQTRRIYDDRFATALGVDYFAMPIDISYARFPKWYFCPKCRKFQPIEQWVSEYKMRAKKRALEFDEHMVRHMRCLDCRQELVVARIVTICEHGHINDFPWVEWVHIQSNKPICVNPSLKLKTSASSSEGLEGITITCSCDASTTLKGVFDKNVFERLGLPCEGYHPHKNMKEECDSYPRTVQRGSSSVYFPVVYSSLVIPPYADKLNVRIEGSHAFANCITVIEDEDPGDRIETIKRRLPRWAERIALEIGASREDVEYIIKKKWLEQGKESEIDVTSLKYRAEEYAALSGEIAASSSALGDFSREGVPGSEYKLPFVKSVSLIEKVRVVNALVGFSRITPVLSRSDPGFVSVKEPDTNWYPAYEVRGEGIFIEFEQNAIDVWISDNPSIIDRATRLNNNYATAFIGQNNTRDITPKFIMLHTLSHLLIKQLSFECGYSIASLSERIYCAEERDGKQMAGIFIYTASGDSEGTLGGLVRQGWPDVFPRIFKKAIASARTCSNDPVCILSHGQGRDSLNLAACYACALLPETCCEERNAFLDRALIIGTYDDSGAGFYSSLLKP